jgi:hypothetical protein
MAQTQEEPDRRSSAGTAPSTPLWVKIFGIIFIILVLLIGAVLLLGIGGPHGPARHLPSGSVDSHTLHFSVTASDDNGGYILL